MSDKIKELSENRDAAMVEAYAALFVKDNATIKYRDKQKIFGELDKQLKQALQEEAENDARNCNSRTQIQ